MMLLVDVVDEHPGPLNYDLMRCGARLRDWPDDGVTWGDLVDLIENAQPDTATYKALNPRWQQDVNTELLRSMEATVRVLSWQWSGDKREPVPEPWLWPWDEQPEVRQTTGGSHEELMAALGWELIDGGVRRTDV